MLSCCYGKGGGDLMLEASPMVLGLASLSGESFDAMPEKALSRMATHEMSEAGGTQSRPLEDDCYGWVGPCRLCLTFFRLSLSNAALSQLTFTSVGFVQENLSFNWCIFSFE